MKKVMLMAILLIPNIAANAQHTKGNEQKKVNQSDATYETTSNKASTGHWTKNSSDVANGKWTMELLFNPFSNNYTTFSMAGIKSRYFFSSNNALRLNLGLGIDGTKHVDKDEYDNPTHDYLKDNVTTAKDHCTSFSLGLGYEYHFFTARRLDLYTGFEVGYKGRYYSGSVVENLHEEKKYDSEKVITRKNNEKRYKQCDSDGNSNRNSFFTNILFGADYYLSRNLYVGAELGLGLDYGKGKNGYYTIENNSKVERGVGMHTTSSVNYTYSSKTGESTTITTAESGKKTTEHSYEGVRSVSSSSFGLRFYAEPALRIGVRF